QGQRPSVCAKHPRQPGVYRGKSLKALLVQAPISASVYVESRERETNRFAANFPQRCRYKLWMLLPACANATNPSTVPIIYRIFLTVSLNHLTPRVDGGEHVCSPRRPLWGGGGKTPTTSSHRTPRSSGSGDGGSRSSGTTSGGSSPPCQLPSKRKRVPTPPGIAVAAAEDGSDSIAVAERGGRASRGGQSEIPPARMRRTELLAEPPAAASSSSGGVTTAAAAAAAAAAASAAVVTGSPAAGKKSPTAAATTPSPRLSSGGGNSSGSSSRRRGGGPIGRSGARAAAGAGAGGSRDGSGRLLYGMAPEAGTGSSSTDNSPRRSSIGGSGSSSGSVSGNGKGKGKGKARAKSRLAIAATSTSASANANGSGIAAAAAAGPGNNGSTSSNSRAGGRGAQRSSSGDGGQGGGVMGGEEEDEKEEESAAATASEDPRVARIEQLRELTKSCLEENMSDTAAYYADKLVTFSNFDRGAVLLLAKAQFACGAYLRTVHLLAQHRLLDYADNFGLRACHLAARSLRAADKTEESVSLLEKVLGHTDAHAEEVKARAKATRSRESGIAAANRSNSTSGLESESLPVTAGVDVLAALCCLRGQAYANLDNRPRAAVWLRTALEIDARCVEALQCLTRWHLLSIEDQASMVSGLDYGKQDEEEGEG
ncbi:unnamed protein product, partial [Pylaiella littoralis]